MSEKKFGGRKPQRSFSLTDELVQLDRDLAALIARRTMLLGRAAHARQSKGKPLADPQQERRLRQVWDAEAGDKGMDLKMLRQIFTIANGLAYSGSVKPEKSTRRFVMYPHLRGLDLTMPGPKCTVRSRIWTALYSMAGKSATLEGIVLNDSLIDLAKSLNKAGGAVKWDNNSIIIGEGDVSYPGKTVFMGDDVLNMYLHLAFALPQVGRMTFTGGAPLKVLDLRGVAHVFAGLGARLTPIEPHLDGVPVRMESAGLTTNSFRVPDDFPAEAALAMALAGPTFPEGIRFTWGEGWKGAGMLSLAEEILGKCGLACVLRDDEFSVPAGSYNLPGTIDDAMLPIDPELGGVLLALSRLGADRVSLSGNWPAAPEADRVADVLTACGVSLDTTGGTITATPGEWPEKVDIPGEGSVFALATALGLAAPGDARVTTGDEADTGTAETIAERLGRFARVKPGRMVLVAGDGRNRWKEPKTPIASPSADWTLALALTACIAPGIELANPGSLSTLWPGFWSLYADNFRPKSEEPKDDDSKKGRRVRIG